MDMYDILLIMVIVFIVSGVVFAALAYRDWRHANDKSRRRQQPQLMTGGQ